jgi:RmuC family protein
MAGAKCRALLSIVSWRWKSVSAEDLSEAQRRQDERLEKIDARLRDSHTAFLQIADELKTSLLFATQGQIESHSKATSDLTVAVSAALVDFSGEIRLALVQAGSSQDERLDKIEGALQESAEMFRKAMDELTASLLVGTREQGETHGRAMSELRDALTKTLGELALQLTDAHGEARREQTQALVNQSRTLEDNRQAQVRGFADLQEAVRSALDAMRDTQMSAFNGLQDRVQDRLEELRKDNEAKLEKIRSVVEEKLHATLETRLGESFRQVTDQLEQVYKGLGEMRTLATGVGDLKRVLTNVRSRGAFGEVQLGALLASHLISTPLTSPPCPAARSELSSSSSCLAGMAPGQSSSFRLMRNSLRKTISGSSRR